MNPDDIPTKEMDVSAFRVPPDKDKILGSLGRAIDAAEIAGKGLSYAIKLMKEALSLVEKFNA